MQNTIRLRHLPLSQSRRIVEPTSEPITLADAKAHLRVLHNSEDSYIQNLITTARMAAEEETRRAFCLQTWQLSLDAVPAYHDDTWWDGVREGAFTCELPQALELPRPPLHAVTSVTVFNEADVGTVWEPTYYTVDTSSEPGRLMVRTGGSWPLPTRAHNGLVIEYVAGYPSPAMIPSPLKHGILMLIAELYRNREMADTAALALLPYGVTQLWRNYTVRL